MLYVSRSRTCHSFDGSKNNCSVHILQVHPHMKLGVQLFAAHENSLLVLFVSLSAGHRLCLCNGFLRASLRTWTK